MPIPHVGRGKIISAEHQNRLIDQVNTNTEAIALLGGDPAAIQEMIDEAIEEHANAPEPHKAYDLDIPSLTLIFENGLL